MSITIGAMIKNAFELVLKSAKEITPQVLHMVFARADGRKLNFIPGQFITFHLPHGEKLARRSYSIATIPGSKDEIEIAAAYYEGGIASELLFNLQPGQSLTTTGPFGRLILKDEVEQLRRYILVATGTGVSPYRSMLPALAERLTAQSNLHIELILGVRSRDYLLYGEDFIQFAKDHDQFNFRAQYSRQMPDDQQAYEYSGYVQETFDALQLNPDHDIVYLCGNPNMIDDSFALLQEFGFDVRSVRREKYISS